jgi:DNA end-binding protein Ku
MVSIPVKIYSSSESAEKLEFHTIHTACGSKVRQQLYCPACETVVDKDGTSRGYEHAKGQHVLLSPAEYKALLETTNNSIELARFIPPDSVDPVWYEKAYYLGADRAGARGYRLLVSAMTKAKRLGVALYAARGKQHLVLVRAEGERLIMHQVSFADQVKPIDGVPLVEAPPASPTELKLAGQLIERMTADAFRPEDFRDDVKARLRELIERKVQGKEIVIAPEVAPKAKVIDLTEALKASIATPEPEPAPAPARARTKRKAR